MEENNKKKCADCGAELDAKADICPNCGSRQKSPVYKRWWFILIAAVVVIFLAGTLINLLSGGSEKEIPNVFGVDHEDAVTVIESKGFEVTEIEADAESILSASPYNRSVKKGEVFKINDETDPNPFNFKTKDKNVVIYYAEQDYVFEDPDSQQTEEETEDTTITEAPEEETAAPEKADEQSDSSGTDSDSSEVSPQFKETMDSYEAFFDDYVEFMKKYKASNGTDPDLLADYADYTAKYADMLAKLNALDQNSLSTGDALYMTEVTARITQKLAEIGE